MNKQLEVKPSQLMRLRQCINNVPKDLALTIEIYTKAYCPYCWRAKELLEAKGVEYREISVDYGGEERQQMVERAQGRTTVPQIFIREHHVGGCDDLVALEHAGVLDELLGK
jgi:glutaredoxin 3